MNNITLVLPIGGKSSRFPGTRPKWMLTHPKGTMMLTEAIRGLDPKQYASIVIIALESHEEEYHFKEALTTELMHEFGLEKNKIRIRLLKEETRNQPETVYEGIVQENITGSILIKDSDNYFELDVSKAQDANFVAVVDLHHIGNVNPSNKSYVKLGNSNTVTNIAEKKIISNLFCCGAYCFKDVEEYKKYFKELEDNKDLYISHIIYKMILDKQLFFAEEATNYIDWGTLVDWRKYTNHFSTIFVDLDGVLVENSAEHFEPRWGTTKALANNVAALNRLYESNKALIVITTARKESAKAVTEKQLADLNIKHHRIIYGLPHTAKRVLINDYAKTNPYPAAVAINLQRNHDNLQDYLWEMLE